jgi:GcrA cell cycle regulator
VTFSDIARILNERFGTGYTRNAAIGRARRLGLSTPERANSAGVFAAARKPDARKICEKRARNHAKSAPKPTTVARAAVRQLRCVEITPRHLALIDLERRDCRYPFGGDLEGESFTFCGHPRREGSRYCASHAHFTSLPEPGESRVPVRAPLRLVEAARTLCPIPCSGDCGLCRCGLASRILRRCCGARLMALEGLFRPALSGGLDRLAQIYGFAARGAVQTSAL